MGMAGFARGLLATGAFIFLSPSSAFASDGADSLKISPAARDLAMGSVWAMSAGAESLFYNPAGVGGLRRPALSLTHAQLYEGVRLDALGLACPLPDGFGRLGASFLALTMTPIEGRDEQGLASGSFNAMDGVFGLSWAGEAGSVRIGATLKGIEEKIAGEKAVGYALDLGAQGGLSRLQWGAAVRNAGPKMKFIEDAFDLPLSLDAGAGYLFGEALFVQCGLSNRPHGKRTLLGAGAELRIGKSLAVRAGYSKNGTGQNPLDGAGFGAGWRPMGGGLRLDYAFTPGSADLGAAHRITLGFEFGEGRQRRVAAAKPRRVDWDNFWRAQNPWVVE
jgi:hypothetical protein